MPGLVATRLSAMEAQLDRMEAVLVRLAGKPQPPPAFSPPEPLAGGTLPARLTRVIEAVAEEWGVTGEAIRSRAAGGTVSTARHVAMTLAATLLDMPPGQIARLMAREEADVVRAIAAIRARAGTDEAFGARLQMLAARLGRRA